MPNETQILAFAIADEIGHLVLPFDLHSTHSLAGIMRAGGDPQVLRRLARGRLFFTPEQGQLIRRGLMSR